MKYLFLISLMTVFAVQAQGQFVPGSPYGAGPSLYDSNAPKSNIAGPTNLGLPTTPIGDGTEQLLDRSNTAPTPIPGDTSLIQTPSNDPLKQSQEDIFEPDALMPLPEEDEHVTPFKLYQEGE